MTPSSSAPNPTPPVPQHERKRRKALVIALEKAEVPAGFAEHPWLRDVKPLRVTGGIMPLSNKLQVQLDPVLGIVYRSADDNKPEEAQ